jgi:hypothetical protein
MKLRWVSRVYTKTKILHNSWGGASLASSQKLRTVQWNYHTVSFSKNAITKIRNLRIIIPFKIWDMITIWPRIQHFKCIHRIISNLKLPWLSYRSRKYSSKLWIIVSYLIIGWWYYQLSFAKSSLGHHWGKAILKHRTSDLIDMKMWIKTKFWVQKLFRVVILNLDFISLIKLLCLTIFKKVIY